MIAFRKGKWRYYLSAMIQTSFSISLESSHGWNENVKLKWRLMLIERKISIFLPIANSQPVFLFYYSDVIFCHCVWGEKFDSSWDLLSISVGIFERRFFLLCIEDQRSEMADDDGGWPIFLCCFGFCLMSLAWFVLFFVWFVPRDESRNSSPLWTLRLHEAGPSICFSICCTEPAMSRLIHGNTQEGLGCWLGLSILLYGTTISSGRVPFRPIRPMEHSTQRILSLSIPLATCPPLVEVP